MKQQFFILFMIITLELKLEKPKFHYLANTTQIFMFGNFSRSLQGDRYGKTIMNFLSYTF